MFVKAKYSEIYDLSTQSGDSTVLKFHTPMSILPQCYLRGFFIQFKKYKYVGTKITMIPAATLPADPLQVSYEAGEPTIDPRDMVNPILHKPYHGEALGDDTNAYGITQYASFKRTTENQGTTGTPLELAYYATLQDPSWKKSHIQRGFSAYGNPLVRPVASNFQIAADGAQSDGYLGETTNHDWSGDPDETHHVTNLGQYYPNLGQSHMVDGGSADRSIMGGPMDLEKQIAGEIRTGYAENAEFSMFTSGFKKLGWMDTTKRMFTSLISSTGGQETVDNAMSASILLGKEQSSEYIQRIPKIYTYIAMLPPAYKTEMYFRLVLTHYFNFKDFRGASMPLDGARELNVNWLDATVPAPAKSTESAEEALSKTSVEVENGNIKLTSAGVSAS